MNIKLQKKIDLLLRKGDLSECSSRVEEEIKKHTDSPFHLILDLHFTNPRNEVASYFDTFINNESKKINLNAIYTETNGFSINPDVWFFNLFGFEECGGYDDLDWISDWQTDNYPEMVLTGMEKLQKIYASDDLHNEKYLKVIGLTSLLVVIRFQTLIKESAVLIKNLKCPILATSHEYSFIYTFKPPGL